MSANEYARLRGRDSSREPAANRQLPVNEKRAPRPPTAAEQERAAANRALVREHLPEVLPFIKELHELGMIDGWRNVEEVTVTPNQDAGSLP